MGLLEHRWADAGCPLSKEKGECWCYGEVLGRWGSKTCLLKHGEKDPSFGSCPSRSPTGLWMWDKDMHVGWHQAKEEREWDFHIFIPCCREEPKGREAG